MQGVLEAHVLYCKNNGCFMRVLQVDLQQMVLSCDADQAYSERCCELSNVVSTALHTLGTIPFSFCSGVSAFKASAFAPLCLLCSAAVTLKSAWRRLEPPLAGVSTDSPGFRDLPDQRSEPVLPLQNGRRS